VKEGEEKAKHSTGEVVENFKQVPKDPELSFAGIQLQYGQCIREAASVLVCNYASLNMAIDMGFSGRKTNKLKT